MRTGVHRLLRPHRPLLALFVLTGATGLIYEVVWTRLLALSFGSSILAVSTVLTAFMGGLALGAAWLGKRADLVQRPIRLYALLELGIGLYALATPWLFPWLEMLYLGLHRTVQGNFWSAALLRFALSIIVLLPPTILMGGTLPVLARFFLRGRTARAGRALSALYSLNTAGAVAGTLLAGLLLLPMLGGRRLLLTCGLANLGIAALAMLVDRYCGDDSAPAAVESTEHRIDRWSPVARLGALALGLSGTAALIYEVTWSRVLTLVIGSSTYAFTIMLATFLTGIALGSAAIRRWSGAHAPTALLLTGCQILTGLLALLTAAMFAGLPDAFVALFDVVSDGFAVSLAIQALLCGVVMLPATLCMGASLPLAAMMVVETSTDSGRRIGLLYSANTVGAILGAFLAGFVLLPTLGIRTTLVIAVFINLTVGLGMSLFFLARGGRMRFAIPGMVAVAIITMLLFVWQPTWNRHKMTSGPHVYAAEYQQSSIDERLSGREILFYREGPIATVSVARQGQQLTLAVDGKTDAGNLDDMTTQVLLASVPLLLRPEATDVLVIGFASGITTGAAGCFPVQRLDSVELEPAMREASAFFTAENYDVLNDPRSTLTIDDARSYLLTTRRRYDVVISEPSNPWQAGSSRLFTREAFTRARAVLKPGGVMAQWMHLYWVDPEMVAMITRTFRSVFPHATLWMDPQVADIILVGSTRPIEIDPLAMQALAVDNAAVAASLSRIGCAAEGGPLRAYVLGEDELARFAGEGAINTDDRPLLEYRAPRAIYSDSALRTNIEAVRRHQAPACFPPLATRPGQEERAAALLQTWSRSLAAQNCLPPARGALRAALTLQPREVSILVQLADLQLGAGERTAAIATLTDAIRIEPENGPIHAQLGGIHYQDGDHAIAHTHLRRALALGEESADLRNNLAATLVEMGNLDAALDELRRALELDPDHELAGDNVRKIRRHLERAR